MEYLALGVYVKFATPGPETDQIDDVLQRFLKYLERKSKHDFSKCHAKATIGPIEDLSNTTEVMEGAGAIAKQDLKQDDDYSVTHLTLNTPNPQFPVIQVAWVYTEKPPRETRAIDIGGGIRIHLVWIDPGEFIMGSPVAEKNRNQDEKQRRVVLTKGFWMGVYEVTQEQWLLLMHHNPSPFMDHRNPVERVSWSDCQEFIEKLNAQTPGGGFRLPSEAEWEYACRAGTTTRFYWGDDPDETHIGDYAWYTGNISGYAHPVGEKKPNPWDLCDMSGNLFEWCQDYYGNYTAGPVTNPTGPSVGIKRIHRGGSWGYSASGCRSAYRGNDVPTFRSDGHGFRVARDA